MGPQMSNPPYTLTVTDTNGNLMTKYTPGQTVIGKSLESIQFALFIFPFSKECRIRVKGWGRVVALQSTAKGKYQLMLISSEQSMDMSVSL